MEQALKYKGILYYKGNINQVTERFRKVEFVILFETHYGGNPNQEYVQFQAIQDKCEEFANIPLGSEIEVDYSVGGKKYQKKDNTGEAFFNSLTAYKVNVIALPTTPQYYPQHSQQPQYQPAPGQPMQQQPAPGYAQQPQQQPMQQPAYQQPQQPMQQPPVPGFGGQQPAPPQQGGFAAPMQQPQQAPPMQQPPAPPMPPAPPQQGGFAAPGQPMQQQPAPGYAQQPQQQPMQQPAYQQQPAPQQGAYGADMYNQPGGYQQPNTGFNPNQKDNLPF